MADGVGSTDSSDVLDPVARERLASLGARTGKDVVGELTALFLTTVKQRRQDLDDAVERGDVVVARSTAHTIKGSAAAIGAVAVARVCGELEAAVVITRPAIARLLARLDLELERAEAALGRSV
ncbi:MAG: Hpt domain-containing protein [Frankia sp.]|nr:Hpt domain-containing protein [Frankia sp.]